MTDEEFYRDLQITRHDESQSLLITSRRNEVARYLKQSQLEIPIGYLPTITFVLKFKDNKWKCADIEPLLWPEDSNTTPTNENAQIAIKEVEDYFNETYPTYEVYSLYEKMKEE